MRILLAGCNGLLGQNLLRTAADRPGWEIAGLGLEPEPALAGRLGSYQRADLGDRRALLDAVDRQRPDWIVNAAALTDVDTCERNPELNDRINRDAVGWLAATGVPLVQVSTDYVFDGEAGPYSEEDATRPLSRYGRAKLESEALALSGSPRSLVLRTMLLWGAGRGMKKSFTEFVRESLAAGKAIRVVTDQWGNPTLAHDLAEAVWALMERNRSGLYHAAGSDWMSRFDWAAAVAGFYGLDASLLRPAVTADLGQEAHRPLRSGLRSDKLARDTGARPRGLSAQLEWLRDFGEA